MRVIILSHHCPSYLKQPLTRDSKSKALLLAMSKLAEKSGNNVLVSNNKFGWITLLLLGKGG